MTILEYQDLEERGDERLELIHGRLVREPAPGGVHGVVLLDLLHALHEHVRSRGLGRVIIETGVRYPRDPATVRRGRRSCSVDRGPACPSRDRTHGGGGSTRSGQGRRAGRRKHRRGLTMRMRDLFSGID
jgi:hypothetical protein